MKHGAHRLVPSLFLGLLLASAPVFAQVNSQGFDDYGAFVADPVELDNEVANLFGRFFQTSLHVGTGIFNAGGLATANAAGVNTGLRFVYYFDREFALELGADYSRHATVFDTTNLAGSQTIQIEMTTQLFPVSAGLRYGFDPSKLTRGFATLNPFLAANAELFFRTESVIGTPDVTGLDATQQNTFGAGSIIQSKAFALSFGGGFEFDVYRRKFFLGLDMRYHLVFWPDATSNIGKIGRNGNYITLVGTATYSY
jgi:hypothetical protein